MQWCRMMTGVCLFVVFFAGSVAADELGWVDVTSDFQAQVVEGIVGQAHQRDGNSFLISITEQQRRDLERAGIELRMVPDLPVEEALIARPRRPLTDDEVRQSFMDKVVDCGGQTFVVRPSQVAGKATADNPLFTFHPVEDVLIRVTWLPPTVASFMRQAPPDSDTLANLINPDSLQAFVERLEAFQTRYIWTDSIDAARDWMVQKLTDWGYTDVTTPSFNWSGGWHYNVMAVKPGTAEPDNVIVIGGHYDSIVYGTGTDPFTYAPGADDNASGTVIALELARVLANVDFRKTIIFMAFSAEEVGLVGSYHAAQDFVNQGTNLEVMFNYDMVAHDPNNWNEINISAGANKAYRDLQAEVAQRVTGLVPVLTNAGGSSDHASFMNQGFNVSNNIEEDFNYAGWHTELDISSRLDFNYMSDVARMAIASLGYVADAAHPTEIEEIVDMGDGQTLQVIWTDCDLGYYVTTYWGTTPGVYTDSFAQTDPTCAHYITGLTEGVEYYFTVVGKAPGGYPAVYGTEASMTPRLVPRTPTSTRTDPGFNAIELDWDDNREADLSHYRIYRAAGAGAFELYQDNVTMSSFSDANVNPQVQYHYQIAAVDNDGYQSDPSQTISGYAATFDGGILVVDELTDDALVPNEAGQLLWFDSLFGEFQYATIRNDASGDALGRNEAGRYSSIFWLDDDLSSKLISESEDSLDWYVSYPGNLLVAGWRTMYFWHGTVEPGTMLYDDFGISSYTVNSNRDFAGATGQNGWPNVTVDLSNPFGNLPEIPIMTPRPGATTIYTYDSESDDPTYEGQPCAVLYDDGDSKQILLGFPLYHLTTASSQALIDYAASIFGESAVVVVPGDMNGDGITDPVDLAYFVDYLYVGGAAPPFMNSADVNADCTVDPVDLAYFVDFLFSGGSAPLMGCVN